MENQVRINGNGIAVTARDIREEFQLTYATINHYTNLGLFSIVKRVGNKRFYDRHEVEERFQLISKLANQGYPLSLIRRKITEGDKDELL